MDGDAGHLGHRLLHETVERRATDDEAVALDDGELVYLHLQLLTGAAHQDAFLLQRPDQIQDAADVFDGGGPCPLGAFAHYLGAETLAAEQLLQHGAVILIAHQVGARHAAPAGGNGRTQVAGGAGHLLAGLLELHQQLFCLLGEELGDGLALSVHHPLGAAETDELVCLEIHRHPTRHLFGTQVEALTGDRAADGGDEHQTMLIQLAGDSLHVDAPHPAAVAVVDAIFHPQRLGGDEVAAHHADARALHGGVGQPHGELGRDVVLQTATHLFDDGEALVIGDPDPSVVLGLDAGAGQRLVVLRTRAEYQD